MDELNFIPKINQIKKDITQWNMRNLTTLGKITIVKSLLLPKLTHLFFSLPSPTMETIKSLNELFYKYIWGNKRDKISRKQIIQDYDKGGCRMIDIHIYIYKIVENYMVSTFFKFRE